MKGGDLMLMVGDALKKRRDAMGDDAPPKSERGAGEPAGDEREHLEQIAGDFIDAVKAGDKAAVADLFLEAFECCESYPHDEAAPDSAPTMK